MATKKKAGKLGRKKKPDSEKVLAKGVYLTKTEWDAVEQKYGSGTAAFRKMILPTLSIAS